MGMGIAAASAPGVKLVRAMVEAMMSEGMKTMFADVLIEWVEREGKLLMLDKCGRINLVQTLLVWCSDTIESYTPRGISGICV